MTGLPKPPLPAYATYVITGRWTSRQAAGRVTTALHAGRPDTRSAIQFSRAHQENRIIAVTTAGGVLHISGRVDGALSLRPGETRTVEPSTDRSARQVRANFLGDEVMLDLEQPRSPSTPLA